MASNASTRFAIPLHRSHSLISTTQVVFRYLGRLSVLRDVFSRDISADLHQLATNCLRVLGSIPTRPPTVGERYLSAFISARTPAESDNDDDPDCMAVALPHPYAPRRPKATLRSSYDAQTAGGMREDSRAIDAKISLEDAEDDARDRQDVVQYLSIDLIPRDPPRPRAAGGMRGAPRMINVEMLFWRCHPHRPTPSTSQSALSASPKASTRFLGSLRHARAPSGDECDNTKAVVHKGKSARRSQPRSGANAGRYGGGNTEDAYRARAGRSVEGTHTVTGRRRREHAATDECGGSSRKRRQDTANRARSDTGTRADGGDHDRANHGRPAATAAARMRRRRPVKRFDSTPPHTPSRRAPARPQERGDHALLAADVHEQDLTSMFIIPKTASSPHSTPLDDGLRAMRHPFDQLPSPIIPPLNPVISQQGEVLLMMRDLRRCAQHATKSLIDDGTRERGEEGECRFPSSKAVYTPLPRPGIDEEALDFEGGDPHGSSRSERARNEPLISFSFENPTFSHTARARPAGLGRTSNTAETHRIARQNVWESTRRPPRRSRGSLVLARVGEMAPHPTLSLLHYKDCTPRGRGALGAVESGGVGEDKEAGGMSRANRAPLSTFSASWVACATSRDTGKVFGGCGRGQQRRGAGWKGRDNARSRRRGGHLAVQ
ncbi:uncharacterized protein SCHCODRAFT_02663903 [Schizophyllum commune H4-8]|uniref:Uncharacterized protein n=1 Tax=Schizophyllum commune (strain H4-8 / FGSC 9210) TaxID=578458 RepID=D8PYN0_SCHCM|nr:uncharacterized protein SCHCODRAFT_02663903 [Schizophyllum commune H4-8]KAI5896039.1 hypothetical protein SCHCODRAFT_02663903 [Schizophyllum commune H4-8]